jgi:hypothetical protein
MFLSASRKPAGFDCFQPIVWSMDGTPPMDGCLAARSRRVFGFGLCETVVFQLARVSVGSVRVFISYLEDR